MGRPRWRRYTQGSGVREAAEKVGKGRAPKEASFHVRFTDTGKRRWSTPFKSVEDANANSEGVKIASEAAAKGLTVAEFQDTLNTGRPRSRMPSRPS